MKALLSLAILSLVCSLQAAQAQNEFAISNHTGNCPSCSSKQQKILKLQAEIASLKGESSEIVENFSEPVPITPVEDVVAPAPATSDKTYTVQAGDGLMKIARVTGCKASDIAAVNNMAIDAIIHPGQVLKLPTTATVAAAAAPKAKTYTIQEGETYYRVSRRLKIPVDELMAANPKIPANRLYAGRVIQLPGKDQPPAPAAAPVEAPRESAPETSPETASNDTPAAVPATAEQPAPEAPSTEPAPLNDKKIVAVSVDEEISYGDFAAKHGTTTERLNSLNDLNLTSATILAKGSELYVPASVETASN